LGIVQDNVEMLTQTLQQVERDRDEFRGKYMQATEKVC
jgi:hypothetical protein